MSNQNALEATVVAAASKVTYTGAGAATVSWFASSEFGVIAGLLIAAAGLLTNLFFQVRRDRREEREHQRRMDKMSTDHGGLNDG